MSLILHLRKFIFTLSTFEFKLILRRFNLDLEATNICLSLMASDCCSSISEEQCFDIDISQLAVATKVVGTIEPKNSEPSKQ